MLTDNVPNISFYSSNDRGLTRRVQIMCVLSHMRIILAFLTDKETHITCSQAVLCSIQSNIMITFYMYIYIYILHIIVFCSKLYLTYPYSFFLNTFKYAINSFSFWKEYLLNMVCTIIDISIYVHTAYIKLS